MLHDKGSQGSVTIQKACGLPKLPLLTLTHFISQKVGNKENEESFF